MGKKIEGRGGGITRLSAEMKLCPRPRYFLLLFLHLNSSATTHLVSKVARYIRISLNMNNISRMTQIAKVTESH